MTENFTCASCFFSSAQYSVEQDRVDLVCRKTGELATEDCGKFVYEPGTDEGDF